MVRAPDKHSANSGSIPQIVDLMKIQDLIVVPVKATDRLRLCIDCLHYKQASFSPQSLQETDCWFEPRSQFQVKWVI